MKKRSLTMTEAPFSSRKAEPAFRISSKVYIGIFLLFISPVMTIRVGICIYDYFYLRNLHQESTGIIADLENRVLSQKSEIEFQKGKIQDYTHKILKKNEQIQKISSQIDSLQTRLGKLFTYEKQIIAQIENFEKSKSPLGVGGSLSEDREAFVASDAFLKEIEHQISILNQEARKRKNGFDSVIQYLDKHRRMFAATPSILPVSGRKSSPFGFRVSPFTGFREFHKGLDIAALKGTPVNATADGVVTCAGPKGSFGNFVEIDHGNGVMTRYAHLDRFLVKRNQKVKKGDRIARVGSTGLSTGYHLHYEILLNGIPVNPEIYISKQADQYKKKVAKYTKKAN